MEHDFKQGFNRRKADELAFKLLIIMHGKKSRFLHRIGAQHSNAFELSGISKEKLEKKIHQKGKLRLTLPKFVVLENF